MKVSFIFFALNLILVRLLLCRIRSVGVMLRTVLEERQMNRRTDKKNSVKQSNKHINRDKIVTGKDKT